MQSGVKTIILTKSEIRMRSKDKKLFNPEKLQKINAINFFLPFGEFEVGNKNAIKRQKAV